MRAFFAGLREVMSLREAHAVVDGYGPATLAAIREAKRKASARLRASRRLSNPRAALELLATARALAAKAASAAGREELPALDEVDLDALPFAELEARRDRIELEVGATLASTESRSPTELRGLTIGRYAAIVLAVCAVLWSVSTPWRIHDVALGKPVTTSPLLAPPATPEGIVDGRTRGTFGLQTMKTRAPFVTIDLQRTYRIRRIKIYNRGDGWFDEILPLSLEVSTDGITFQHVATRTDHFAVWDLRFDALDARWVRVSKDNGYIALNEIEVYARD